MIAFIHTCKKEIVIKLYVYMCLCICTRMYIHTNILYHINIKLQMFNYLYNNGIKGTVLACHKE